MLVALTAGLIGEPASHRLAATAVAIAVTAVLLDGVDGWLARRSRMASEFGGRFDMETDALLIMALSVLVWRHDKAGVWVLGCGLMRYAFVAAGWLLPWMAGPLTPTRRGKTVAVAQVVGLTFALLPIVPPAISRLAAAATLAALTWSFAVDVRRLWARARLTAPTTGRRSDRREQVAQLVLSSSSDTGERTRTPRSRLAAAR